MELILNLLWIALALPAVWLWRNRRVSTRTCGALFTVFQVPLILGAVIVLLFPVISASDDLHTIRAEMEESSTGKRSICHASGESPSVWHCGWHGLPAITAKTASIPPAGDDWHELVSLTVSLPAVLSTLRASRAPPHSSLA